MTKSIHAVLATALLAMLASCTEEVEVIDDAEDPVVTVTRTGAETGDPSIDTLVTTSCHGDKVLICHVPPGSPENAHNICVSEWAVSAHLQQHTDVVGTCRNLRVEPPPPVCMPLGAECSADGECCSGSCVWNECIDHI
jgi:hypothetical protein